MSVFIRLFYIALQYCISIHVVQYRTVGGAYNVYGFAT